MALKELTVFLSEDTKKSATVYRDTITLEFKVIIKNDSGSTFSATFDSEDTANDFAEDYVI